MTQKIYTEELCRKEAKGESCCNSAICWYNPPQDNLLVKYCQETHLHGLKFVAQPSRHLLERVFWLVSFISGILFAGYLISDVWRKYQSSPVIMAFSPLDLSISQIQFPAVTICNVNKVQKRFATHVQSVLTNNSNDRRAREDYYVMNSVCTSKPTFAKRIPEGRKLVFNETNFRPPNKDRENYVADFLYKASQPCAEMLQRCSWSGTVVNCSEIFFPLITELGICCTFNLMPLSLLLKYPSTLAAKMTPKETENWRKERAKWEEIANQSHLPDDITSDLKYPRRQYQAGQTNGLSLLLFPDLDNYFCTASDSSGFRVAFHSAIETPHVTEFGKAVPPGADMYVEVYPEVTTTEPIVSQFSVSERHCYYQHEQALKYYNYYTQLNCIYECESDEHRGNCSCSWYYEPRYNSTTVCVPNEATITCSGCVKAKYAEKPSVKGHCAHCLPLCTQIKFGVQSSLSMLLNSSNLWVKPEELGLRNQSNRTASNKPPIWLGKPVTILNVYYGDDSVVPKQRQELYGSTDLFANTGGLLGLCLGFSGLSAVEILYFCMIRLWCRKREGNRNVRRNWSKICSWFTKPKSHKGPRSVQTTYNITVNLDKDKIPFWPSVQMWPEVKRIDVGSSTASNKSILSTQKMSPF